MSPAGAAPERGAAALAPARRALDALVFSSVWVAAAAAALTAAAARAMGIAAAPAVLGLAFCGTLAVYAIDRLRDLPRDRARAPARSAFVERHARALALVAAAAALGAGVCALLAGARALALAGGVGALGLAHRRLKRRERAKPAYLAAAWTAVAVGLPALAVPGAAGAPGVAAVVAGSALANAIGSGVRDRELGAEGPGEGAALGAATIAAGAALALALLGPAALRPLAWLPALTVAALLGFRRTERYGLVVLDGALLAGALLALASGPPVAGP